MSLHALQQRRPDQVSGAARRQPSARLLRLADDGLSVHLRQHDRQPHDVRHRGRHLGILDAGALQERREDQPGGPRARAVLLPQGNYSSGTLVEPFPPNFKMVQGYAMAMSLADANAHGARWGTEMYWGCSDNKPDGKFTAPINCATGVITLHVGFPTCWDGVTVGGDAIAAGHVRFSSGGKCPAGFPHKLPRLIERLEYPVGTSSGGIAVASGAPYTMHADFWNTWQMSKLSALVTGCLNANKDCGTNP